MKTTAVEEVPFEKKRLKIVAFTGAGISQESGIDVFRSTNVDDRGVALWENHPVDQVADIKAWKGDNKARMLEFYDGRRRSCLEAQPNAAHFALAELAQHHDLTIVTQNIDDLHERAGSDNVIHVHGELLKVRPENQDRGEIRWEGELKLGDVDENGVQLRPHVVWFGEGLIDFEEACDAVYQANILIVIGTSLNVQPAASIINLVKGPIYMVDPYPRELNEFKYDVRYIKEKATIGVRTLVDNLIK